jgi:hypothetical protein
VIRRFAVLAAALVLTGCGGVPTTSSPKVVGTVAPASVVGPAAQCPAPGSDPRTLVYNFLAANGADDPHHNCARQYLTPEAKNRWSDSTVTVLDDLQVSLVDSSNGVTVSGQLVGQVGTAGAAGAYTPSLQGDGSGIGGAPYSQTFHLVKTHGQWRIGSPLPEGLLVTAAEFDQYQQRVLYFFDLSEQRLVPDPRFTEITDPQQLANWLLDRLSDGPRDMLQNAVRTELPAPAQSDPGQVAVTLGDGLTTGRPTRITLPGAAQLDGGTRDRLAAQVGLTLRQVPGIGAMQIVDGGRPVTIPAAGGTRFTPDEFSGYNEPRNLLPPLYYVQGGSVYTEGGGRLPGRLGTGAYHLTSVAVASPNTGSDVLVAGLGGPPDDSWLWVGSVHTGLRRTSLHGRLSRPAWAPGGTDVWIGAGSDLYEVSRQGAPTLVQTYGVAGRTNGRISSVRLSPEGSRIALVLTSSSTDSQLLIGAVVRAANSLHVDGLTSISPQDVAIKDVAWNDELKLFAIGQDVAIGDAGIYELECDGSLWAARGTGNLPQAPDSLTVSYRVPAAVSAGGTVWKQRGGSWTSLRGDETRGANPIYGE